MIHIRNEMAGWFKIEAVKADGSRRVLADWFPNLILNQGLDYLAQTNTEAGVTHIGAVQVGSSSTAPANGQTALVAYIAGTTNVTANTNGAQASSPYYGWFRRVYRFPQGAAAGNLSEVGVGKTAATGSLFSRALILDGGGIPTTITVLADEFLDVTYEIRQYPVIADVTGEVTISGVDYDYVVRPANITNLLYWANGDRAIDNTPTSLGFTYTGPIGATTSLPAGAATGTSVFSYSAYTTGNYYRDVKQTWSIAAGNASGGVGAIDFYTSRGCFQVSFSPSIPKDNTKILEITMRVSWARKTL